MFELNKNSSNKNKSSSHLPAKLITFTKFKKNEKKNIHFKYRKFNQLLLFIINDCSESIQ